MREERRMNHNRIVLAVTAVLAFLGVLCLPQMMDLKGNSLAISNSWSGVFFWGVCWFLLYKTISGLAEEKKWQDKRGIIAAGILALLFSVCLAFGVQLDREENVDFVSGMMWLAVMVWTVIFSLWIYRGWIWLDGRHGRSQANPEKYFGKWNGLSERKQTVILMLFFLLCWLPVFLAVYPGFFVYDAQDELIQVQTRNFTTHHPLPHVIMLGGIILSVHKLTGSYNAGIAVYTWIQMLVMAGIFAFAIHYMKERGAGFYLRALTVIYFAFFPVIVMFTLCSAKDGIFTGALLLLVILIADMAGERKRFFSGWKGPVLFGISALVMMSFRHNGMYAFLVMVPILLVYMKGYRKKLGILCGVIFASYFLATAGLTGILSAEDSENQEMLTVPIQQMARTWMYDKESLTEEERNTLYEIIPEKVLPYYTAKVSDGVKIWFDNKTFSADPGKYMKLWLEIGLKHPFTYLNAWFMTSYGFWYPDTVIDVYRGNSVFTFTYEDSSFFGYEVEQPGVRESKIPWLDEWYRRMSLEITQQKIPVVSMLFSPGFLFWVFAFTGGYTFYRKKYDLLLPFVLILLVWLTVILGPTYLPRYVLILWFALPCAAAVLVN